MAELSFPTNPTLGQTYTSNGRTWRWAGDAWLVEPGSINDSSDVDITAPASGEVLTYNGTTWANGQLSYGHTLDVDYTEGTLRVLGSWGSSTYHPPNSIRLLPLLINRPAIMTRVAKRGPVAPAGTQLDARFYWCIYGSDDSGQPSNLLYQTDVPLDASQGGVEIVTVNLTGLPGGGWVLPPGIYWYGNAYGGTASLSCAHEFWNTSTFPQMLPAYGLSGSGPLAPRQDVDLSVDPIPAVWGGEFAEMGSRRIAFNFSLVRA